MDRKTPFIDIIRGLIPFFVTRQVFAGAGRVGIGTEGRTQGFQLSSRADFFEVEVGLETTLKRPIINTRDEPHADADKYRRLHVIIGDANLAEISTYLKVGTTSLVLAMIEARALSRDLTIEEPVEALQAISHDPSLTHKVRLRDGRQLTAIEVQRLYLEQAEKFVAARGRVRRADRGRSAPLDRGTRRPRDRPDALRRPAGLAGQAAAAGGLPIP